ncbi:MAG: dihydropteroate synthase, partial [Gemmatimonadales bacterium]
MTLLSLISQNRAAVQEALGQRGLDVVHAEATARGVQPFVVLLEELSADARDRTAQVARERGVDFLTGDGWAVLCGGATALASLARTGQDLPPDVAAALGRALGAALETPRQWAMGRGRIALDRPVLVGIVNVTPDSFSDGGRFLDPAAALRHAARLIEEGADMLDVGAESTRPGSPKKVPVEEEWARLVPVLEGLVHEFPDIPISVDTVKTATAARALGAGAWAINDVSGLRLDPDIARVCAEADAGLVLMHSRGGIADMASYDHARYGDLVREVQVELAAAVERASAKGVDASRLVVDPGLGFAKTPEQSFRVLRDLDALSMLGLPVMVGPSRKRFLGVATGHDVADRDRATAAACVSAYLRGAMLFRVHAIE